MVAQRFDFDGTRRASVPISSPWGIGLLAYGGGSLTSPVLKPNGTRFGEWLLNSGDNLLRETGDFDGDGRAEILVSSPWGIGILERSGDTFWCPALQPNGTRFDGWLLNTADNRLGPVGDFDGDGRDEWLAISPWGIGVLEQKGNTFACLGLQPNGTNLGGWVLDTSVDRFGPVGDFDGDGRDEFLVVGPGGVALLKLSSGSFTTVAQAATGSRIGDWLLNPDDNFFWPAADYLGDGREDLLVTSPWGMGILTLVGGALTSRAMVANGTRIGGWLLNTLDNRFAPVGDLDGDGRPELLVVSPWGMGVLEVTNGSWQNPWLAPNGSRFDGWLLNTADNWVDVVADVDGDGRDEIVVTSPWGIGILQYGGGAMRGLMLAPNGTRFGGGWLLNTADNDVGFSPQLLRLHVKTLTAPTSTPLATMIASMRQVYGMQGISVQVVSSENLNLPTLNAVDVGTCSGMTTAEQVQLFGNRNFAGPSDVVAYFVQATTPTSYNGCATFPAGQPGAVIAQIASPWTLAHEMGHVLGLPHVDDPPPPDPAAPPALLDRLMTGRGTWNVQNPPADIVATEANRLRHERLTHNL
ncbi:FG-GAP-like repeat-containing protein [Nocardioides sp. MAHUQ-72]|uniref:FG-GAP-like repeat-containing protein n=1 Tax=unclassified Nocardioides TaxID=2615069 RepID=UPI00361914D7